MSRFQGLIKDSLNRLFDEFFYLFLYVFLSRRFVFWSLIGSGLRVIHKVVDHYGEPLEIFNQSFGFLVICVSLVEHYIQLTSNLATRPLGY